MVSNVILQAFLDDGISFIECLEILAVACGRKKIVRLTGNEQRLKDIEALMQRIPIHCLIAPLHLELMFSRPLGDCFVRAAHGLPHGEEEGVLYAGAPTLLEAAVEMELHDCTAEEAAELYGFPQCCARHYEHTIQQSEYWVDSFLAGVRGMVHAPWLMNRFGRLFAPYLSMLPDYFPCHINCASSLALAGRYRDMLEQEGLSVLAELAKRHLARTVLHHAGCLYLVNTPEDEREEQAVRVLAVWPYAGQAFESDVLIVRLEREALSVSVPGKTRATDMVDHPAACLIFT